MIPLYKLYFLKFLDFALSVGHIFFIVFVLIGWYFRRVRSIHFWSVIIVGVFWFIFGLFYGFGYCPLTDYHWKVKEALGEKELPYSFVEYIFEKLLGVDLNENIVNSVTLLAFLFVFVLSIYFRFKKDINQNVRI